MDGFLKQLILRILKNKTDLTPNISHLNIFTGDINSINEYAAGLRFDQTVQMLYQGRFARAGMPNNSYELALSISKLISVRATVSYGIPSLYI